MNKEDLPEVLKSREVMQYLRISRTTLNKWCRTKKIPYHLLPSGSRNDRRFLKKDVLALVGL